MNKLIELQKYMKNLLDNSKANKMIETSILEILKICSTKKNMLINQIKSEKVKLSKSQQRPVKIKMKMKKIGLIFCMFILLSINCFELKWTDKWKNSQSFKWLSRTLKLLLEYLTHNLWYQNILQKKQFMESYLEK